MILYSIIPAEVVFSTQEVQNPEELIEMDYLGQKVQAVAASENRFIIRRIISTSPGAYLNPRLQPGMMIQK